MSDTDIIMKEKFSSYNLFVIEGFPVKRGIICLSVIIACWWGKRT